MMIKIEPNLMGRATSVELVYEMPEASPFRVTVTTSHECVAEDLYHLAKYLSGAVLPLELAPRGRAS